MKCSKCGKRAYSEYCFQHKPRTAINQRGKQYYKWEAFKKAWKLKHKDVDKYCYLCGKPLKENEVTLDHVIPRSRRKDLVFDESNIKPACWKCNVEKGSKVLTN